MRTHDVGQQAVRLAQQRVPVQVLQLAAAVEAENLHYKLCRTGANGVRQTQDMKVNASLCTVGKEG